MDREERQPFLEPPPKYTPTPSQPPPSQPPPPPQPQQAYPPPPQQPYPPPPQQPYYTQQATVRTVIHQPRVVQQVVLGDYPVQATCPRGHVVTTRVRHEPGSQTWVVALILCFFLGPLCALIPFCIDDMQDAIHECPVCGTTIGVNRKGC